MKAKFLPIFCITCLLVGAFAGWYVGYTRRGPRLERMLSEGRIYGLSEAEIAHWIPRLAQSHEELDAVMASASLDAVGSLERGNTQRAKEYLIGCVGQYYHDYHEPYGGDPKLLARIKAAATTNLLLAEHIECSEHCR